jgi:hypothetical protein
VTNIYTEVHDLNVAAALCNPGASYLLSAWEYAKGGADAPAERALLRRSIEWLRPDLMILRQNAEGDLVYDHYGGTIARMAGFDMTGQSVSEFKGALGAFFLDCYRRARADRMPLATLHRQGRYDERPMWERLIAPVVADDGRVALYVVNTVRKIADDFALASARARGNGVIALQFVRDADGAVSDALIAGANAAALRLTGRRLDELLDRSILECFPGVMHHALWDRYMKVAETREAQAFTIDYRSDGLDSAFDIKLHPFRDGVAIDFRILADASTAAAASPHAAIPA